MPFPHRKFRRKRDELGLTRAELAERSSITPRYIEALEQGRKPNPTQDTLEGLCKALGVGCDFFFSDDDPDPAQPAKPGRPKKADPSAGGTAPKRLADVIRERRAAAGLTQGELAARLGVQASSVEKYERGYSRPNANVRVSLCRVLGVDPAEFDALT